MFYRTVFASGGMLFFPCFYFFFAGKCVSVYISLWEKFFEVMDFFLLAIVTHVVRGSWIAYGLIFKTS